jgi:hypothetical protein
LQIIDFFGLIVAGLGESDDGSSNLPPFRSTSLTAGHCETNPPSVIWVTVIRNKARLQNELGALRGATLRNISPHFATF